MTILGPAPSLRPIQYCPLVQPYFGHLVSFLTSWFARTDERERKGGVAFFVLVGVQGREPSAFARLSRSNPFFISLLHTLSHSTEGGGFAHTLSATIRQNSRRPLQTLKNLRTSPHFHTSSASLFSRTYNRGHLQFFTFDNLATMGGVAGGIHFPFSLFYSPSRGLHCISGFEKRCVDDG